MPNLELLMTIDDFLSLQNEIFVDAQMIANKTGRLVIIKILVEPDA